MHFNKKLQMSTVGASEESEIISQEPQLYTLSKECQQVSFFVLHEEPAKVLNTSEYEPLKVLWIPWFSSMSRLFAFLEPVLRFR